MENGKDSGKDRATGIPSWCRQAQQENPREDEETCQQYVARLLDAKYGKGNWKTGPGSEYNKLVKNCMRDPDRWR